MLSHVEKASVSSQKSERVNYQLVKSSIKLAMNDLQGFAAEAMPWLSVNHDHPLGPDVEGILRRTTSPDFPDVKEEKVFAIGLSRTGTTSIHRCLKTLGYNSAHFFNPVSRAVLQDSDFHLFNAFSDSPICVSFERLFHRFPKSKFILTTRDLESWTRSIKRHMEFVRGSSDLKFLREAARYADPNNKPMFGDFDAELYFQFRSYEDAYRSFHHRVDDFFVGNKASRLLRIDLSEGNSWGPICKFLDRPYPNVEFPWENVARQH